MAGNIPTFHLPESRHSTSPSETMPSGSDDADVLDNGTLSPLSAQFPSSISYGNLNSPARSSRLSPYTPTSAFSGSNEDLTRTSSNEPQPFNFTPQQYVVGRPPAASLAPGAGVGKRRGHKYARSSVSHQIILSPTVPRVPLQLPSSLPIPSLKEFRQSMTGTQRNRFLLCLAFFGVAGFVQLKAHGMAKAALSHLLFFDALQHLLGVAIDVGRNFEVWNRPTIRSPFGLGRVEVVSGLGMAIVLLFMGLDLISHGLQHSLEGLGGHVAHHVHVHEEHGDGTLDMAALAAVFATLVSASPSGHSVDLGRTLQRSGDTWSWLPRVFRNPTHLLSLTCASVLLALPVLGLTFSSALDNTTAFAIASIMVLLGSRQCYTLGRILLMSFPAKDEGELCELVAEIEHDDAISSVDDAKVWQVHCGLCMANFRIRVRHKDAVERVREKIARLVKSRLGGDASDPSSAMKWEISSMIVVETI